jgi:hypothetical protein
MFDCIVQFTRLGQRDRRVLALHGQASPAFVWRRRDGTKVKHAFAIGDIVEIVVGGHARPRQLRVGSPGANAKPLLTIATAAKALILELDSSEQRDRLVNSLEGMTGLSSRQAE